MNPLATSMATLAISTIYCLWHAYRQAQHQRERQLRERVTYMLWMAAIRNGNP
jgi:hypothetical protein